MNSNPYYVENGRLSDEEKFLAFWSPTCGIDEAKRAWQVKVSGITTQAPMVQDDIAPYVSQIDGSMIESRSRHKEHLRQHNCTEVGNETKHLLKQAQNKRLAPPPGLREMLIAQADKKLR